MSNVAKNKHQAAVMKWLTTDVKPDHHQEVLIMVKSPFNGDDDFKIVHSLYMDGAVIKGFGDCWSEGGLIDEDRILLWTPFMQPSQDTVNSALKSKLSSDLTESALVRHALVLGHPSVFAKVSCYKIQADLPQDIKDMQTKIIIGYCEEYKRFIANDGTCWPFALAIHALGHPLTQKEFEAYKWPL